MPKCPDCGSPMRIALLGSNRQYECSSNSLFKIEHCWGTIDIDPKKDLSMTEISENLVSDYAGSDDRRKEQTNLKRTETGLQQCEDRYGRFLSKKEIKALQAAQKIVSKYRTAVEKSKEAKIRIERQEKAERERQYRKEFIETADEFLAGLDQEKVLLKCEVLDEFSRTAALYDRLRNFKQHPTKDNFNALKFEVGKEIRFLDLDSDPVEIKKFEEFKTAFLKQRDVKERREAFKIIKSGR